MRHPDAERGWRQQRIDGDSRSRAATAARRSPGRADEPGDAALGTPVGDHALHPRSCANRAVASYIGEHGVALLPRDLRRDLRRRAADWDAVQDAAAGVLAQGPCITLFPGEGALRSIARTRCRNAGLRILTRGRRTDRAEATYEVFRADRFGESSLGLGSDRGVAGEPADGHCDVAGDALVRLDLREDAVRTARWAEVRTTADPTAARALTRRRRSLAERAFREAVAIMERDAALRYAWDKDGDVRRSVVRTALERAEPDRFAPRGPRSPKASLSAGARQDLYGCQPSRMNVVVLAAVSDAYDTAARSRR